MLQRLCERVKSSGGRSRAGRGVVQLVDALQVECHEDTSTANGQQQQSKRQCTTRQSAQSTAAAVQQAFGDLQCRSAADWQHE